MKSLKDISWDVSEETYRSDPALSYSTLARYEREGFNNLDKLFDKIESPSLTFGSCVDSIITGGQEEFNNRFIVAEFPPTPDSIIQIVKVLFNEFADTHTTLDSIPDDEVIGFASRFNYQNNWKPKTRAEVIKKKGSEYYNLLFIAEDKTIIDINTYHDVCNAVNALRKSEATKFYFAHNNPFVESNVERFYQLKFKATIDGIEYRCMFDELIVDHDRYTIQPIDLKTSCNSADREWDFAKHYVGWNYQIQNRLYVRILQEVIYKAHKEGIEHYNTYTILPYKDIIIFKGSNTPMVYDIPFTFLEGTLYFGKNNQIEMRDPFDIGKELNYYLKNHPKVPIGFDKHTSFNIETELNKL